MQKRTVPTQIRAAAAVVAAVVYCGILPYHVQAQTPAAAASPAPPAGLTPKIPSVAEAVKTLRNPPYFALGAVGFHGEMSTGDTALRVVLHQKNAPTLLRGLLRTATPAGQLYALVGMRQLSVSEFARRAAPFGRRKTVVLTYTGYMSDKEPMSAVVARIKTGSYDLFLNPKPAASPSPAPRGNNG